MGAKKRREKRRNKRRVRCKRGAGIVDKLIDILPFELHVPSYQYCGPGTNLKKRLARGDPGINPLDAACKQHDIEYSKHHKSEDRTMADKVLQKEAMKRILSKDASLGERAVALGVAAAMKAKRSLAKIGSGLGNSKTSKKSKKSKKWKKSKKKRIALSTLIKSARNAIKKSRPDNIESAIKVAVASVKQNKKGKRVNVPREIKMPTITGGILPAIPIFAVLSALGTLAGTTASITNAINSAKRGQRQLDESKRHNTRMEEIAIGNKSGKGFYLRSAKNGNGFYLQPYQKNR